MEEEEKDDMRNTKRISRRRCCSGDGSNIRTATAAEEGRGGYQQREIQNGKCEKAKKTNNNDNNDNDSNGNRAES